MCITRCENVHTTATLVWTVSVCGPWVGRRGLTLRRSCRTPGCRGLGSSPSAAPGWSPCESCSGSAGSEPGQGKARAFIDAPSTGAVIISSPLSSCYLVSSIATCCRYTLHKYKAFGGCFNHKVSTILPTNTFLAWVVHVRIEPLSQPVSLDAMSVNALLSGNTKWSLTCVLIPLNRNFNL